jgi:hypothetical protein
MPYRVWIFLDLLGRGVHIVRGGAAMCLYHFYDIVCSWGLGVCLAIFFSVITHVLGVSKFQGLGYLCIYYFIILPK